MSFSQHGPRAVCILSANGAISNVTLRQPATSGGTVTYEVCEIDNLPPVTFYSNFWFQLLFIVVNRRKCFYLSNAKCKETVSNS